MSLFTYVNILWIFYVFISEGFFPCVALPANAMEFESYLVCGGMKHAKDFPLEVFYPFHNSLRFHKPEP